MPPRITLLVVGALTAGSAAAPALAEVRRAESVMPPGQSGFVSPTGVANGTGSPHLHDQTELFVNFRHKSALFNQPGTTETPRPGVTVVRDGYGVPAVTGQTDDDLWFGAGYAVAQDRLFQLELYRRATRGRLAELLGKGYLDMDIATRRDLYTDAELETQLAALPPHLRARFDGYRDGVNAWIAETRRDPDKLPGEFAAVGATPADWTVLDSAAIGVYLARTTSVDAGEEMNNARALKALGPRLFNGLLPIRVPGQAPTIPRREGVFPSQPGRTKRDERAAFARSRRFVASLELPSDAEQSRAAVSARRLMTGRGRTGASKMWAIRSRGRTTTLFTGPQQGFIIPNQLVEIELHGPGFDARGVTAAGVPVIGAGRNAHVAWGITSTLSDDNDLYVEQLASEESYRHKGRVEQMTCRDEEFSWRTPPTDLIPDPEEPAVPEPTSGSQTERLCRTVHGPVQARTGGVAFARRYAIWGREAETLVGLAGLETAKTIKDADRALDRMTWGINFMVADDRGNIGYWHAGLFPLRPRRWDERLPYPGTGEAEWRGLLPPDRRPQVVNPRQGYLSNWNNVPSHGWTSGDGPARERLSGAFHRGAFLERVTRAAYRAGGSYEETAKVDRITGTVAEQRPLAARRLKLAHRGSRGPARTVLKTILAWDGSYHRVDGEGMVDPGVAAFEAFKRAARERVLGRYGEAVRLLQHGRGDLHAFDILHTEAYALRVLGRKGWRRAAADAFTTLEKRFESRDPAKWRERRRDVDTESQGAASFPPIPVFDRGTTEQLFELGP